LYEALKQKEKIRFLASHFFHYAFEKPSQASIFVLLKDKAKIKSDIINPIKENWSCEE